VWLEETKEGFCAHAICTAGYDRNGTVGFDEPAPHSLQTTTEALQAVMRKYERVLLGVPTGFRYDVQEDVDILAIPSVGKKLRYRAPHAALMDPLLHNDIRRHEAIALTASSAAYDELIRQHPSVPTFHLARFDALRREGVDWKDDQFREAFHRLCELRPHDPLVHENAALHHLDCNRTTNAIDHYLSAIKAGSREPTVIRQLIKLAPRLDDYIREYGTEHLNEALPALRVRAGTLGYLKDDLVLVRICAAKLGKPDEYLAVLEARAHYYGQALEELGSGRHRRDDYAAALVDLMREQVASGRIGDATATFERIRSVRGPGASMRDALPSLHHLPYREDTVALYRSILEGCPGWSGGHMELVEYLYTAGKVDQAVEELRKAIGVCKDVTALMLELKSMPGLKQHTEWPAIQSALLNRRYELRSRRR
jgi:tetratricopeptide (TPR) repeat protein